MSIGADYKWIMVTPIPNCNSIVTSILFIRRTLTTNMVLQFNIQSSIKVIHPWSKSFLPIPPAIFLPSSCHPTCRPYYDNMHSIAGHVLPSVATSGFWCGGIYVQVQFSITIHLDVIPMETQHDSTYLRYHSNRLRGKQSSGRGKRGNIGLPFG